MKIRTSGYMLKEGLKNLWRNRMMSVASVGSVTATLIILGIIFVLILNINSLAQGAKEQFDSVKVYLVDGITQEDINKTGDKIKSIRGVKDVYFESKEEALRKMMESWGEHGYLLEGLESNPLPNSFIVNLENLEYSVSVVEEIRRIEFVEEVKFYRDLIDKLINITSLIKLIGLVIIIILIGISIFIIGNTIKLTVSARKREISIMKYVGATNWFVRWPFFIEGTLLGLIGALLATIAIYFSYSYIYSLAAKHLYVLLTVYLLLPQNILESILFIFVVIGSGIGALGSLISMRKHLRV